MPIQCLYMHLSICRKHGAQHSMRVSRSCQRKCDTCCCGRWQEVSAHNSAPRIAMAVYQLLQPVLVVLSILLLSLAVVRCLVPLGQHLGHPFNELGRRAQALNSLRKAVDKVLSESFKVEVASEAHTVPASTPPSWADLERSGVLRELQSTQHIWQAAKDPEAFLQRATAGSRTLLLRACAARACSLAPPTKALQASQHLAEADLKLQAILATTFQVLVACVFWMACAGRPSGFPDRGLRQ